jgi:hypothetical protein
MDVNGVLLATYYGQIGKEKVPSHHTRVRKKLRDFLAPDTLRVQFHCGLLVKHEG